jgi:hypothetical protein
LQAERALDKAASKTEQDSRKNEKEIERIIAAMLKGKREREAMSSAHLAECSALFDKLQALLQSIVATRSTRIPALSSSIEQRVNEVRTAVLAEVEALKNRPGLFHVWPRSACSRRA